MKNLRFYIFSLAIAIPAFTFGIFNAQSDTLKTPKNNNHVKVNIEAESIPWINNILIPGIYHNEFMDVCAIQWNPVKSDSGSYRPQFVNLEKHLIWDEFEKIIYKLDKSAVIKCYCATVLTADGRKIYSIEAGTGMRSVVLLGGVHAREVANPQFLLKFATILANGFENNVPEIVKLLSEYKIIMLPNANPDGYATAMEGSIAVKDKNLFFGSFNNRDLSKAKSNANGVDLNRNFPTYSASISWNGNHRQTSLNEKKPSLDYFAGYYLGSETETKAVMNFIMRYVPFAEKFVDFHSAGRLIYAGKPHLSDKFNLLCEETGKKIRNITKYALYGLLHEISGEGTDGTVTDFAAEVAAGFVYNEKLGRLAPQNKDSLIKKYNELKYPCSVNTVETLKTSRKEGFGLQHTSTPKMQAEEWKKHNLEKMFFSLITD